MSCVHSCTLALAVCIAAAPVASAQDVAPVVIQNARIVPVSGPVLNNGTVVMAGGLIRAIGPRVAIPPEADIIDGTGLTVYPGLIDALTDLGMATTRGDATSSATGRPAPARLARGPEDRPGSSPWLQAADEFRPDAKRLEHWRHAGFTTVMAAPAIGILPGQSAVINLSGGELADAVVRSGAALPITLRPPASSASFPGSLMGVVAYVRQVFVDARHYAALADWYEANPRGRLRPEYDRTVLALHEVLTARTPVLLPAGSAAEIERMVTFGQELDVPFMLYGGHDAAAAAGRLAKAKVPVLVSANWPQKPKDADPDARESLRVLELRERAPAVAAALAAEKVRFAFYSDGLSGPAAMLTNVRKAIAAGLPRDAALRALTLTPAQLYGVGDRLGSLEAGKIANLIVVAGDLFDEQALVTHVFIDGRRFDVPDEEFDLPRDDDRPAGRPTRHTAEAGAQR